MSSELLFSMVWGRFMTNNIETWGSGGGSRVGGSGGQKIHNTGIYFYDV